MKCPICEDEFEGRADAKTCGKSACRKKYQRLRKEKLAEIVVQAAQASPEEVVMENIETPKNPTIQDLRQRFGDQFKIEVSDQDLAQVGTEVWNNRLERNITVGLCKFGPCLDPDCKTRFVLDVLK